MCGFWRKLLNPYTAPLVFADYWRDPSDKEAYLTHSRFLADVNNERREGGKVDGERVLNSLYRKNILGLEKYVVIEATEDTMVYPHKSESHGEYVWGRDGDVHDNEQVL